MKENEQWHQINNWQAVKLVNGKKQKIKFANGKRMESIGLNDQGTLTTWSKDNITCYQETIIPFFELVSDIFYSVASDWFVVYKKIIEKNSELRVGNSVFSVARVYMGKPNTNKYPCNDSQTALHLDGDHSKYGSVLVYIGENIKGSELVFPQYNIASKIEPGDIVIQKGYKHLHGNTPLKKGKKVVLDFFMHRCLDKDNFVSKFNFDG